jgi:hypothetical protein
MRRPLGRRAILLAATCLAALSFTAAKAQTPPAATPAPAADAPPPGYWIDGIHLSAQIQGGLTVNPNNPNSGVTFGRLFDDRANQPLLNQVLLTANKPLDPKATGFDWGFKLQGMYGSDARYTHFLGIFDQNPGPGWRNQFDIVEANVLLHLPFPTEGGMDVKAGMYPTPVGYETIDPSTNPFYSHSYLFNFGLPFKHTGVLTQTHVAPLVDVYLGIDSGVNTTIGCCRHDNNSAPGGIVGFGLNMLDGNLTLVALTHLGPESPRDLLASLGYSASGYMRYLSDAYLTWKVNDKLTLVTDVNWIRDDFAGFYSKGRPATANGFGIAQYLSYALSDTLTFNARAEVYRDDNGFFVGAFTGNTDFVRSELGLPALSPVLSTAPRPTTYGEITVGFTFKPSLPAPVTGLLIRPELRVDSALGGGHPFGNHDADTAVTLASDFVLTF